MRVHLTGRITIEDGERVVDERALPGRQGRTVFARLAWDRGPVHRDVLADVLWPQGPPSTWERTLISVLSRLRAALSPIEGLRVANVSGSYELELTPGAEIDVGIAIAQCDAAERALGVGDHASATASASVATAIARRPFLADVEGAWVEARRAELQSVLVRALETGAEASIGTSEAVAAAGEAVELDPYRERANALLIRAERAVGNSAEALRSYERYRTRLADELGTDPGPDVQALYLDLLRSDDTRRLDALAAQGLVGLPSTRTTFVGRVDALDEVGELARTERLVTLTGAGGVGKTRLAIEAARRCVDAFPDGVWFVDLAPFSGSAPIVEHVATTLGMRSASAEGLASILDGQRVLLVLDNCEQILDSVVPLVETLLRSTTGPVVVVTSRTSLNIADEHVWRVPSLSVPSEDDVSRDAESVALFCDRATVVRPDFELTSANRPAIAAICARLDGVPLAIELAAARTSSMSANEIAERLDDRFAVLRGATSGLARHRTLRTTIDWSYDLLGPREAEVFRQLAVFEGSFTLEDASAICDAHVDVELGALCTRSLVTCDDDRYRLLETIKEYARERAQASLEWNTTVERHIDHFARAARSLDWTRDQLAYLRSSELIRDNATAALDRACSGDRLLDEIALASALAHHWFIRGLTVEGRAKLERTVDRASAASRNEGLAPALLGLALLLYSQREVAPALAHLHRALEVATASGDDWTRALVHANIASTLQAMHGPGAPLDDARLAIETGTATGNDMAVGVALLVQLYAAHVAGEYERANEMAGRALEVFRRCGNLSGEARAMMALAGMEPLRADWRDLLEDAAAICRTIGDRLTEGIILFQIGAMLGAVGEIAVGIERLQDAVRLNRRIGAIGPCLDGAEQIAVLAAQSGNPADVLRLLSGVDAQRTQRSAVRSYSDIDERYEELLESVKRRAGRDADTAWIDGARLTLEQICDRALSMRLLGLPSIR